MTSFISGNETVVNDTRWTFTAGGACSRTAIQTLVAAGTETTTIRACTYTLSGSTLSVVFEGSSFVNRFTATFSGADLLLDGFRFTRIG